MKTLKVLEIMWFTIAFAVCSFAIFQLVTLSFTQSIGYFVIAILAFAIGLARKRQRTSAGKVTKSIEE